MVEKNQEHKINHHFVLIHGFGHGAWCWYKLVALLKLDGHRVTALDLGGGGPHTNRDHVSSFSDYLRPLMDFMAALPEDEKAILVGHSYGGIPISMAMENFPGKISLAVFVTAYMPDCTNPPATLIQEYLKRCSRKALMDCEFTFDEASGNLPISGIMGPDYLASTVYKNCSLEDLELCKLLIRPGLFFLEETGKESLLSPERYGRVKRCYVITEGDAVMEEQFQRYNIDKSPPDDVIFIPGAAHMVQLTKPLELCSYLLELAEKYWR